MLTVLSKCLSTYEKYAPSLIITKSLIESAHHRPQWIQCQGKKVDASGYSGHMIELLIQFPFIYRMKI